MSKSHSISAQILILLTLNKLQFSKHQVVQLQLAHFCANFYPFRSLLVWYGNFRARPHLIQMAWENLQPWGSCKLMNEYCRQSMFFIETRYLNVVGNGCIARPIGFLQSQNSFQYHVIISIPPKSSRSDIRRTSKPVPRQMPALSIHIHSLTKKLWNTE
jgi:hypothetical protein